MMSLKSVTKRQQQLHARIVKGLVAFCFCPLEEKIVYKSCFRLFFQVQNFVFTLSRADKHAELLKIYFKSLVKKISTVVAKSDLKFKVH